MIDKDDLIKPRGKRNVTINVTFARNNGTVLDVPMVVKAITLCDKYGEWLPEIDDIFKSIMCNSLQFISGITSEEKKAFRAMILIDEFSIFSVKYIEEEQEEELDNLICSSSTLISYMDAIMYKQNWVFCVFMSPEITIGKDCLFQSPATKRSSRGSAYANHYNTTNQTVDTELTAEQTRNISQLSTNVINIAPTISTPIGHIKHEQPIQHYQISPLDPFRGGIPNMGNVGQNEQLSSIQANNILPNTIDLIPLHQPPNVSNHYHSIHPVDTNNNNNNYSGGSQNFYSENQYLYDSSYNINYGSRNMHGKLSYINTPSNGNNKGFHQYNHPPTGIQSTPNYNTILENLVQCDQNIPHNIPDCYYNTNVIGLHNQQQLVLHDEANENAVVNTMEDNKSIPKYCIDKGTSHQSTCPKSDKHRRTILYDVPAHAKGIFPDITILPSQLHIPNRDNLNISLSSNCHRSKIHFNNVSANGSKNIDGKKNNGGVATDISNTKNGSIVSNNSNTKNGSIASYNSSTICRDSGSIASSQNNSNKFGSICCLGSNNVITNRGITNNHGTITNDSSSNTNTYGRIHWSGNNNINSNENITMNHCHTTANNSSTNHHSCTSCRCDNNNKHNRGIIIDRGTSINLGTTSISSRKNNTYGINEDIKISRDLNEFGYINGHTKTTKFHVLHQNSHLCYTHSTLNGNTILENTSTSKDTSPLAFFGDNTIFVNPKASYTANDSNSTTNTSVAMIGINRETKTLYCTKDTNSQYLFWNNSGNTTVHNNAWIGIKTNVFIYRNICALYGINLNSIVRFHCANQETSSSMCFHNKHDIGITDTTNGSEIIDIDVPSSRCTSSTKAECNIRHFSFLIGECSVCCNTSDTEDCTLHHSSYATGECNLLRCFKSTDTYCSYICISTIGECNFNSSDCKLQLISNLHYSFMSLSIHRGRVECWLLGNLLKSVMSATKQMIYYTLKLVNDKTFQGLFIQLVTIGIVQFCTTTRTNYHIAWGYSTTPTIQMKSMSQPFITLFKERIGLASSLYICIENCRLLVQASLRQANLIRQTESDINGAQIYDKVYGDSSSQAQALQPNIRGILEYCGLYHHNHTVSSCIDVHVILHQRIVCAMEDNPAPITRVLVTQSCNFTITTTNVLSKLIIDSTLSNTIHCCTPKLHNVICTGDKIATPTTCMDSIYYTIQYYHICHPYFVHYCTSHGSHDGGPLSQHLDYNMSYKSYNNSSIDCEYNDAYYHRTPHIVDYPTNPNTKLAGFTNITRTISIDHINNTFILSDTTHQVPLHYDTLMMYFEHPYVIQQIQVVISSGFQIFSFTLAFSFPVHKWEVIKNDIYINGLFQCEHHHIVCCGTGFRYSKYKGTKFKTVIHSVHSGHMIMVVGTKYVALVPFTITLTHSPILLSMGMHKLFISHISVMIIYFGITDTTSQRTRAPTSTANGYFTSQKTISATEMIAMTSHLNVIQTITTFDMPLYQRVFHVLSSNPLANKDPLLPVGSVDAIHITHHTLLSHIHTPSKLSYHDVFNIHLRMQVPATTPFYLVWELRPLWPPYTLHTHGFIRTPDDTTTFEYCHVHRVLNLHLFCYKGTKFKAFWYTVVRFFYNIHVLLTYILGECVSAQFLGSYISHGRDSYLMRVSKLLLYDKEFNTNSANQINSSFWIQSSKQTKIGKNLLSSLYCCSHFF